MSHPLDNYGGDASWDRYCAEQDAAYKAMTASDCKYAHKCPCGYWIACTFDGGLEWYEIGNECWDGCEDKEWV